MMDDPQTALPVFTTTPHHQTYSTPSPPAGYGFDIDMSKRPMELSGGPESKKPRWSPNSFSSSSANGTGANANTSPGANSTTSSGAASTTHNAAAGAQVTQATRPADPFANYGYGNQHQHQQFGNAQQQQQAFGGNHLHHQHQHLQPHQQHLQHQHQQQHHLYSTPSLTINTNSPGTVGTTNGSVSAGGMPSQLSPSSATPGGAGGNGNNGGGYNVIGMGLPGTTMLGGFPYSPQLGSFQQRLPSLNIPTGLPTNSPYSPATLSAAGGAFSPHLTSHHAQQQHHQQHQQAQAQAQAQALAAAAAFQNPAAAAAAAAAAGLNVPTARTVYIGNLPPTASVDELLNLVHFGPLESIRVLPEKSCVFLSFLNPTTASQFHADATLKKLALHGQELKIGWGKPSAVPSAVLQSIQQSNASRNVYIGGLDENMTEEMLRDELSRFGLIDQVKIVRDKNIGFVHFLSISTATKVVATLPTEPQWAGKRVNYGKDRCAYVPKSQQAAAMAAQAVAAQSLVAQQQQHQHHHQQQQQQQQQAVAQGMGMMGMGLGMGGLAGMSPLQTSPFSPYAPFGSPDAGSFMGMAGMGGVGVGGGMAGAGVGVGGGVGAGGAGSAAGMNRTIYLGNIHPETTTEDLCNAIRGGVLQSIRYMQDKHIAFVTFIDPTAAFTFYQVSSFQGLTLNNRRLKIGWGKNSGPLTPQLALAVHSGATRNVYIGNVEDFDRFNEEKLRTDFAEFGDIELVNFLKEKNCAFVNFTNISNAIKAIEGIKLKPDYANLRIAHGKDRCANPPRSGPQVGGGGGGMRRSASGNTAGLSPSGGASTSGGLGADDGASGLVEGGVGEFELGVEDEEVEYDVNAFVEGDGVGGEEGAEGEEGDVATGGENVVPTGTMVVDDGQTA